MLVVVTVMLAIVLFYGWRRSVPALFLPLAVATVYAFALASLPPFGITELNSNTAFLGSIIVGNGINFGIIQLARYVEARRPGETVEDSLALALWATRKGTLSAALAAGVAYASLVAMQFRGFRQFGVIGGLGMLLAWGTTYLLMPPLIAWLDRGQLRAAAAPGRRASLMAGRRARGDRASRASSPAAAAVLTLLGGLAGAQLRPRPARVRLLAPAAAPTPGPSGEGYWGKKMDVLLQRYLTPTAILTDSEAEARAVEAKLRAAGPAAATT